MSLGGAGSLPLDRRVMFKAVVQEGGRVQVPGLIRSQFKLEPTEVMQIQVLQRPPYRMETYFGRMRQDGRLTIPKLIMRLCEIKTGDVVEVTLSPPATVEEKEDGST